MVTVYRVSAIWNGFPGAPGYSRFAFQDLITDAARNGAGVNVHAFFDALKAYIPSGTTIQVQGTVDGYDMATGVLTSSAAMTSVPAAVTSTQTPQTYVAGAGVFVGWNTSVIFNGHRIKGRTFLVPIVASYFDNDGSPISTLITTVTAAGNTLASGTPDFAVWSRQMSTTKPAVQIGGAIAPVDSCTVKDQASGLRSRRP